MSQPNSAGGRRILLILPCFNEAGAIAALLTAIRAADPTLHTIVIDDCSLQHVHSAQ